VIRKQTKGNPYVDGFKANAPDANVSIAKHVQNAAGGQSQYISASHNIPKGAGEHIKGKKYAIDLDIAKKSGVEFLPNDEVRKGLRTAARNGNLPPVIYDSLMKSAGGFEGEVLLKGTVPKEAVKPWWVTGNYGKIARGTGKTFALVGIVHTGYNLYSSMQISWESGSLDPFIAEVVREGGSWGGGMGGAYAGAALGTVICPGVGTVIGGIAGGIIGGIGGSFAGDYTGDMIYED
jgi:Mu-like prophage protein